MPENSASKELPVLGIVLLLKLREFSVLLSVELMAPAVVRGIRRLEDLPA